MNEIITSALTQFERDRGCRILFAVESGSRAWGFASPDSDYDVRVVYVKPLDWYLGLEENRSDTMSVMLPHDLDISAWELRKALRQFLKSNASFLEWIGSPIVYSDSGLIGKLKDFLPSVFNPGHVAFHYASMFRHAVEDKGPDGMLSVKKLCYALRANLAVDWILENETMPPTEFLRILDGVDLSCDERAAIDMLLEAKAGAREKDRVYPDPLLCRLLADKYDILPGHKWKRNSEPEVNMLKALETVFRSYVC